MTLLLAKYCRNSTFVFVLHMKRLLKNTLKSGFLRNIEEILITAVAAQTTQKVQAVNYMPSNVAYRRPTVYKTGVTTQLVRQY